MHGKPWLSWEMVYKWLIFHVYHLPGSPPSNSTISDKSLIQKHKKHRLHQLEVHRGLDILKYVNTNPTFIICFGLTDYRPGFCLASTTKMFCTRASPKSSQPRTIFSPFGPWDLRISLGVVQGLAGLIARGSLSWPSRVEAGLVLYNLEPRKIRPHLLWRLFGATLGCDLKHHPQNKAHWRELTATCNIRDSFLK